MTTFLHTADWQLGKPFGNIADEDGRAIARRARLDSIDRLGAVARERGARFVVVAGDLFDSDQPSKSLVQAACERIGRLEVPVFVIPGNHDAGTMGSVWRRDDFARAREAHAKNLVVLLDEAPVVAPGALLLPCPLVRRHTVHDPGAWLARAESSAFDPALPRVVVAHGSVHDFESDSAAATNQLDVDGWREAVDFDFVALGDWHGTKAIAPDVWYSGTHEQDRFRHADYDAGNCLVVRLDGRGALPVVEKVRTGALSWHALGEREVHDAESLDALVRDLGARLRLGHSDLVQLRLRGSLGLEEGRRLAAFLDEVRAKVVDLDVENEVREAPTEADLAALAGGSEPLVAQVATRLRAELASDRPDAADVARRALRRLFELRARPG